MDNLKINMTFECLTWRQPIISHIITKCIETTLGAENITVPCEINVMVTDDKGIHAINLAIPPKTGTTTSTPPQICVRWAICAFLWSAPSPRQRNTVTA